MRVEVKELTVYTFTDEEQQYLIRTGLWYFLAQRLQANERIEIE